MENHTDIEASELFEPGQVPQTLTYRGVTYEYQRAYRDSENEVMSWDYYSAATDQSLTVYND